MIERLYVKFQAELGAGSAHAGKLLRHFGNISAVFAAPPSTIRAIIKSPKADKLLNGDFTRADEIIKRCRENDIKIICFEQKEYPERLRNIPDPPALLYCKGDFPEIDDHIAVAVVGPRKPDDYGIKAAFSLSARLARGGAIVVSGGAMGIDAEAHGGALWAGGQTIAVLGCGILFPYLKSNEELRRRISNQGAVVSEYPPDAGAFSANFPMRNRIMAGLSLGTVVVQAAARSGALITARHASEQGRDVFVVPGRSGEKLFAGSNLLLKDGAKPVLNVMDILEEYAERYPHRLLLDRIYSNEEPPIMKGFLEFHAEKAQIEKKDSPDSAFKALKAELDCSQEAKRVYEAIASGADSLDLLAEITGLDTPGVIVCLTELEIGGYIMAAPGGRYKIKD